MLIEGCKYGHEEGVSFLYHTVQSVLGLYINVINK